MAALVGAPAATAQPAAPGTAPVIKGVSPREGSTAGGTEVEITGERLSPRGESCNVAEEFEEGTPYGGACAEVIVYFGSEPGLVFAASPGRIDVVTPERNPGNVSVIVTTPGGSNTSKPKNNYTYVGAAPKQVPGPLPVISSVSPPEGTKAGFTRVKISGENLLPAGEEVCVACAHVVARFGPSAVPVLEGTQHEIFVVSPPHPPAPVDVTVKTNPGGMSMKTPADRFSYH